MRARWALGWTATLTAAIALAVAPSAAAAEPVSLGSSYVQDDAGVLGADGAATAEARLEQLAAETDVELWVVYVDEFTGPADAEEWANTTAERNGLGVNQYLLAVAVDSRQYYLSGDAEGPVSYDALGDIEIDRIQPELRAGDYAGAAVAAADGLTAAVSGGGISWIVVGVVVAVAVVIIAVVLVRRRRGASGAGGAPSGPPQPSLEELQKQSGSALVRADDAIKTGEQELGFARAQFGDAAVAEFAQALAQAKADLDRAFTLQQQLDDSTPDTPQQERQWRGEIIALCASAEHALEEKAAAFDALRDLEKNAPAELDRVRAERAGVDDRIAAAESRLGALAARYADEALATVADNPAQARERIAFADAQIAEAGSDLDAGRAGEAAVGIRAAQEAVAQAVLLTEAVDRVGADLAAAADRATALATEIEADIATATALPDPQGRIAAAVAAAQDRLAAARAALGDQRQRPLEAFADLEAADKELDAVIQEGRDAVQRQRRAVEQLDQVLMQARAQVSAGNDFISARRGAVGAAARTRLSEAATLIDRAEQLRTTDPVAALAAAQRAAELGGEGIRLARNDVSSYASPSVGGSGYGYGSSRSSGGDAFLGALIGGLLSDGGSRRSSGWGGYSGGGSSARRSGSSGSRSRSRSGGSSGGGRSRRGGGRF